MQLLKKVSTNTVKIIITSIIVILLSQQIFSQNAGYPPHDPRSNSTSRFYNQNDLIKAKSSSDKSIAWKRYNNLFSPKNWFYRGLIYQKFYEDFDSLNTSFENKYFRDLPEADIKYLYDRLTKDTTLVISMESYLKCFCSNIINDTLNFYRLTNESIYRKNNIMKFGTFEFEDDKYLAPLKDTILPQILEHINNTTLPVWGKSEIYSEIFKGIIENVEKQE